MINTRDRVAMFLIFCLIGSICCLIFNKVSKDHDYLILMDVTWGLYTILFLTSIRYYHFRHNDYCSLQRIRVGRIIIWIIYIMYWSFIIFSMGYQFDIGYIGMIVCSVITAICDHMVLTYTYDFPQDNVNNASNSLEV
jgi:hypothetical protein